MTSSLKMMHKSDMDKNIFRCQFNMYISIDIAWKVWILNTDLIATSTWPIFFIPALITGTMQCTFRLPLQH